MFKNYFPFAFIFLFFLNNINSQNTHVPDDNFEQALIDLGYDDVLDDYVLTANISGVTDLNLYNKIIYDLKGIEGFTSLEVLTCVSNYITTLDLSQNTALIVLDCFLNQITSLDITQNTSLQSLRCFDNQLASLDVTQNTALTNLECMNNQLTSLNVSQNINLETLRFYNNQLTSIDVTQNIALTRIDCFDNNLTSLDLTQNTALTFLSCKNNQLTYLDLSQNTVLTTLYCQNNQLTSVNVQNGNNSSFPNDFTSNPLLTCIQVDDYIKANNGESPYLTFYWHKDATAVYYEDCAALGLDDEVLEKSITLYPNPVTNILTIDSEIQLTKVEIFSLLGQKVKDINSHFNSVNVSNLSKGVYIVKLQSENGFTTKKLIKK